MHIIHKKTGKHYDYKDDKRLNALWPHNLTSHNYLFPNKIIHMHHLYLHNIFHIINLKSQPINVNINYLGFHLAFWIQKF